MAAESPSKKKRKKKLKSGIQKTTNDLVSSWNAVQNIDSQILQSQMTLAGDNRGSTHFTNKIPDYQPGVFGFLRENKTPLISHLNLSSDTSKINPSIDSPQQFDPTKSAIERSSFRHIPQQQKESSPGSAAGKIINPYTGQLEPRDLVDSNIQIGQKRLDSSPTSTSYSTTRMLTQPAQTLEDIAQLHVPHSSSTISDNVHVTWSLNATNHSNYVSMPISTTTAVTAASTILSGNFSHVSSVTSHLSNVSANTPPPNTTSSLNRTTIYAGSSPWQNISSSVKHISAQSSPSSNSFSTPQSPFELRDSRVCSSTALLSNGPVSIGNEVQVAHSEMGNIDMSKVQSSSLESVINTSVNLSFSPLPSSHAHHLSDSQLSNLATQQSTWLAKSSPALSSAPSLSIPRNAISSTSTKKLQSLGNHLEHVKSSVYSPEALRNIHTVSTKTKVSTTSTSPPIRLLNSLPERHKVSHNCTENSSESKLLCEGDDNSNHSGLVTDSSGDPSSGTIALLEHSRVKLDNHDSGVGSSSERSDDTPSEPGDGEFRQNHPVNESNENGVKVGSQPQAKPKPVSVSEISSIPSHPMNLKSESSFPTKSNIVNKGSNPSKKTVEMSGATSDAAGISQFYDAHCKSMEKQAGLMSVRSVPQSPNHLADKYGISQIPQQGSKKKENGPFLNNSVENRVSPKMNGPSSQGNVSTVMLAMNDIHPKRIRLSPKQASFNSKDDLKEEVQSKEALLERLSRLQHRFSDQRDPLSSAPDFEEMKSVVDVADVSHRYEQHSGHLFVDLESVDGKLLGNNGSAVVLGSGGPNSSAEGKDGNITSIYSKRTSPVNVNMLNHIYAPGLPLPRRLTESVQRLVKPLPMSEMAVSVSAPRSRAYNSRSPVSSAANLSPRSGMMAALAASNNPHQLRLAHQSGARSPGASIPRLIPNDQHKLLSGGLDLAGVTNLAVPTSAYTPDSSPIADGGGPFTLGYTGGPCDDHPGSVSISLQSPSNLLRDVKPYGGKMLSQSYPPFMAKDHFANTLKHYSNDIQIDLNVHKNNMVMHRSIVDSSGQDSVSSVGRVKENTHQIPLLGDPSLHSFNRQLAMVLNKDLCQNEIKNTNHSKQYGRDGSDLHRFVSTSQPPLSTSSSTNITTLTSITASPTIVHHSNTSSPLMPTLQRGQEPLISRTLPSNMCTATSSQPPLISLATPPEISISTPETSPLLEGANNIPNGSESTVIAPQFKLSKHSPKQTETQNPTFSSSPVPYPQNSLSSINAKITNEQIVTSICNVGEVMSVPTLSPVTSRPLSPSLEHSGLSKQSSISATSSLSQVSHDRSSPPKLTPQTVVSLKPGVCNSRNIFESVSSEPTRNEPSISQISNPASLTCREENLTKSNTCDSHVSGSLPSFQKEDNDNSKKLLSENGSKLVKSVTIINTHDKKATKCETPPRSPFKFNLSEISNPKDTDNASDEPSQSTESSLSCSTINDPLSKSPISSTASQIVKFEKKITPIFNQAKLFDVLKTKDSGSGSSKSCDNSKETSVQPKSSSSTESPAKEPILETLACAFREHTSSNPDQQDKPTQEEPDKVNTPHKSTSGPLTYTDMSKLEQTMILHGKMMSIQSSLQKKYQHAPPSAEESQNRMMRKRRYPSENDKNGDNSFNKTSSVGKAQNEASVMTNSADKTGAVPSPCVSTQQVTEQKDTAAKISADLEKSHERRQRHRSSASSTHSEDGHSNRSSSTESRDSSLHSHFIRGERQHRSVSGSTITPDRETRAHRPGSSSSSVGEDSVCVRSNHGPQGKELRYNRHHGGEDPRHSQIDWSTSDDHNQGLSGDQKDKTKASAGGGKGIANTSSEVHGSHKKSHKMKRQFYAYVPEKLLDQTYFDVPILTGRTRSRNKPSDEEGSVPTSSTSAPSSASVSTSVSSVQALVTSNSSHTSSSTSGADSSGPGQGAGEGTSTTAEAAGKRSTRSVKTKDTVQEQSSAKRRKVQQQR